MKKNTKILCFLAVMAAFVIGINLLYYHPFRKDADAAEQNATHLAQRIHEVVEAELNAPVMMTRAMSADEFMIAKLTREAQISKTEYTSLIQYFLQNIREASGYPSTFLISDASRRYYTDQGLLKEIDPTKDPRDVWYEQFAESGKRYELSVGKDETDRDLWTVYVNGRIEDARGNFLGVCGVGVDLKKLQELFRSYEEEYDVRIALTDADGLVQVDVNSINIESTYQMIPDEEKNVDYSFHTSGSEGYSVTKYIDNLGWYLVLQCKGDPNANAFDASFLLFTICGFLILTALVLFFLKDVEIRTSRKFVQGATTDALTGVPNRNYFKQVYGERGIFNTTRYKSIAVFDIDFFKEANDTMDGDAILVSVTSIAKRIIGEKGVIFRWGGDEFAILLEWSIDFAVELGREFCREVEKEDKVTVSVGVTEVRLAEPIKKNYYRAAQGCFLVKEMGGNGVKRN